MNKLAVVFLLFLCLLFGVVIAQLTTFYNIPSFGTIKGVGVSITWATNGSECTYVDWGTVKNNTETTLADCLNITNTNNTAITLTLTTENPSPNILSLSLTWNYTGSPLQPREWVIVALTQTVSGSDAGFFSYDTKIATSEATS